MRDGSRPSLLFFNKFARLHSGDGPVGYGSYHLAQGFFAYVTSSKKAGDLSFHMFIGDDVTLLVQLNQVFDKISVRGVADSDKNSVYRNRAQLSCFYIFDYYFLNGIFTLYFM